MASYFVYICSVILLTDLFCGSSLTKAAAVAMNSGNVAAVNLGKVKVKSKGYVTRQQETFVPEPGIPSGKPLTDEQRLLRELMTDYDPYTRPVINASNPVNVKLGLTLNQIFDLDERNQVLTTHIWLDQEWYDDKMKWNPEDFNGLKTIRIPCHLIWKPDIVLYNSADDYINGYMPALAMVSHDGHVFWPPIVRLRSTCNIDITYFPFDDQMCSLKLGSWAYDGLQVDVFKRDKSIDLSNYVSNGEWELINVKVTRNVQYYSCCPEPYPDVNFTLHIRRRTLYYTYNVIIPCIMLSSLTLLGFWIPPEGGEKVGLGLTILLAYSVFMLLIAENMPATSFYIPLIGVYIIVAMGLTCLTVIFSVAVSFLHHQGNMGRQVPGYLRTICKNLNKCFGMFTKSKVKLAFSPKHTHPETNADLKTPLSHSYCSTNSINFNSRQQNCKNCHHCAEPDQNHTVTNNVLHARLKSTHVESDLTSSLGMRRNMTLPSDNCSLQSKRKADQRRANQDELSKKLDVLISKYEDLLKSKEDIVNREWHELAEIVDKTLFWFYVFINFSITVIILVFVPLGKAVTL